ncbi:MAG: hypothetical protein RIF32_19275 [Leptospirales bacterium]|jgi:hypothetical protein
MRIVNQHLKYPRAPLIEPNRTGYIHIGIEIDDTRLPFFLFSSAAKKTVIARAKIVSETLAARPDVNTAHVFRAVARPPLDQPYLEAVRDRFHVARFDVALLIETRDLKAARALRACDEFQDFENFVNDFATYQHVVVAENARRIAEVDKSRQGVFLFNYFFSEQMEDLLPVWEYTAGWFVKETGLDNSTLMMPASRESSQYGAINHCRWDSLSRLLPKLIFMKSMQTYVMENFAANKIAVMPILYRLA